MKRKLMKFEEFQRIEKDSLSAAERELVEAEDILSRALGADDLKLHCFGESDVTYQTPAGNYVHANYRLNKSHVVFESIEELVIDEDTEKVMSRKLLSDFVETLLDDNQGKAGALFSQYMGLPVTRRTLKEATMIKVKSGEKPQRFKKFKKGADKHSEVGPKENLKGPMSKRWKHHSGKLQKNKVNEMARMVENVNDYIDYQQLGPALKNSYVKNDERGNVTSVSVPRAHQRNEAKILSFNWKTLDHELKYSRNGAKNLQKEANFCRAMADLRRHNAVSDNNALEECLENIVGAFPSVLLLTQDELSTTIAQALESANVRNYDDQKVAFMAEGILRMAHHAYADRAKKVMTISQITPTVECDNCYEAFKEVAEQFFPTLDEGEKIKYQVFSDLYKGLHEVYRIVDRADDEAAKSEVYSYMSDCEAVLNKNAEPDLGLAETIAAFLGTVLEANVQYASDTWDVSNDVYTTISGDHPRMAKLAQVDSTPAKLNTGERETLPVADGSGRKSGLADEMKNSWMNYGGKDTAPELQNPYLPRAFGDWTMKGEPGIDKNWSTEGPAMYQSKDTWPNLTNPSIPASPWDKGSYKMKSDNLVTDK